MEWVKEVDTFREWEESTKVRNQLSSRKHVEECVVGGEGFHPKYSFAPGSFSKTGLASALTQFWELGGIETLTQSGQK
jgi:hypothetical protein